MLHVSRGGPWSRSFGLGIGTAASLLVLLALFLSLVLVVAFCGSIAVFLISIAALLAVPCLLILGCIGSLRWVDWYDENTKQRDREMSDYSPQRE